MRRAITAVVLLLSASAAWSDKYGVDEAISEGAASGWIAWGPLFWSAVIATIGGYVIGFNVQLRKPDRDPKSYALIGLLLGTPAVLFLGLSLGWWQ